MTDAFQSEQWIKKNFLNVDLGDKRRTERLLKVAGNMLSQPQQSIPKQMKNWYETKAAYRFFSNPEVKHSSIQKTHNQNVLEESLNSKHTVLFIQDTSSLDYTEHPNTEDLGYIGNHEGRGLMIHSTLAIELNNEQTNVFGLANQQVWERTHPCRKKSETVTQRYKRYTEARLWEDSLKAIRKPSEQENWISIGDRANDIFEFFDYCVKNNWSFVVRASQNRALRENGSYSLEQIRSKKSQYKTSFFTRSSQNKNTKEIKLEIAKQLIEIAPPARLKNQSNPIIITAIRCWNKEEKIEWILYTNVKVEKEEEVKEVCRWYSLRWLIEEYHKCLKTGCGIEKRQLENGRALKAILGILGIIAARLLETKFLARNENNKQAKDEIPEIPLRIICKKYKLDEERVTVKMFWRGVAQMGGFLARKSDGDPGWQTIWKGMLDLLRMWEGALLMQAMMESH